MGTHISKPGLQRRIFAYPHQLPGTAQLLSGLQKVAPICPQQCLVSCDYCDPCKKQEYSNSKLITSVTWHFCWIEKKHITKHIPVPDAFKQLRETMVFQQYQHFR
jgi:hypothetical protein